MTYLEYFHFDLEPFPTFGENNYFFESRRQVRIMDAAVMALRAEGGVFAIQGRSGVGKTVVKDKVAAHLRGNDFVVDVKAGEKLNLKQEILDLVSGRKRANANVKNDAIIGALGHISHMGKNVVFIMDNADDISLEQALLLDEIIEKLPRVRILFIGGKVLKKLLNSEQLPNIHAHFMKKWNLRHLSFIQGISYINDVSVEALSLSQYKKVVPFLPALMLSLGANRNIKNINTIVTSALKDAHKTGVEKVGVRNAWNAIKAHPDIVKENLYLKFQKIFFAVILAVFFVFASKLIIDRAENIKYNTIRENISEQERAFEAEGGPFIEIK